MLIVLFEGRPEDLDDDDDFVVFVDEERATLREGSYDIPTCSTKTTPP